jgi:hypothetical protein
MQIFIWKEIEDSLKECAEADDGWESAMENEVQSEYTRRSYLSVPSRLFNTSPEHLHPWLKKCNSLEYLPKSLIELISLQAPRIKSRSGGQ